MNNIRFYYELAIEMHKKNNPFFDPDKASCLIGEAVELAFKDSYGRKLCISPAGHCDIRIKGRNVEIKTGAGGLGSLGHRLLNGSGLAVYIPVVLLDQPLNRQDGYVMDRNDFLDALDAAGAIRGKDTTRVTIQTFWNRSKNKPHGALLGKMLDAFEERDSMELWAYLEETGARG